MKRAMNFLFGFTMGGLIGATLVLLLTPSSGDELRKRIQAQAQGVQQEMKAAAAARRAELEKQLEALRKPQKQETH